MPYQRGKRLGGEHASKLGHLDVINSDLVNELIASFESLEPATIGSRASWEKLALHDRPLRLVFAVDGSIQTIQSDLPPYKQLSFIKTALLRLDQHAIEQVDADAPHPLRLRDILRDTAIYHATVLPLKGVKITSSNNYDAVRRIVYESFRDESLQAQPYITLKWLSYRKWTQNSRRSPNFDCPHCGEDVPGLEYDADEGACDVCGGQLYLTDMIGFHLEMSEDAAPDSVATAYMLIHETLLLFTGIRYFWERDKFSVLDNALFLKDGPLTLRSQYSKLVIPIREFLEFAKNSGVSIYVAGQEKSGAFVDHLDLISRSAPDSSVFAPDNDYIRREVQHQPERADPYGSRTNYGNKLFLNIDQYHHMVLSIPTGEYRSTEELDDLLGVRRILATVPTILSHRYEGGLVPIELANGVASLSSYPSAAILKVFGEI